MTHDDSLRVLRSALSVLVALSATALLACSGGPDTGGGATPGGTTPGATAPASQDGLAGFYTAGPVSCGGAFDIAYGFAVCSSKKMSGIEKVASDQTGAFTWLDEGSYTESGDKLTFTLTRTVVEPSAIRGDVNKATLVLEKQGDKLVVVSATEMPECTGLELERTDTVTDADCEPGAGGGSSGGGCTADVDCGECRRCERSTGRCLTKTTC